MNGNFDLPTEVRFVAEAIGREQALRVVGRLVPWTGKRRQTDIYVPARGLRDNDKLVQALGRTDAEKLQAAMPAERGGRVRLTPCSDVYQGFRDASIRRLYRDEGVDAKTLCEWFDLSDRHMRTILA